MLFISYFLVFLLAAIPLFELIAVVPLAIIGGLSPIPVAIFGFLGNLVTVLLLILFVDKVKSVMSAKKRKQVGVREGEEIESESSEQLSEQDTKKKKRARALFDKYGLPGLTIFGPLLVGSHISAFMGMSFGSKRSLVTGWMVTSLLIWTIVSTVAASYGATFFIPDLEENGFLVRIFQ